LMRVVNRYAGKSTDAKNFCSVLFRKPGRQLD